MQLAAGHGQAGQYVDLRFEMDTIVALHAGPHPLATGTIYAPPAIRLQARRGIAACRRRSVPHTLPGKCARLHQHRKDVFSLNGNVSTRWCPRVNRGWVSCGAASHFASSISRATRRWTHCSTTPPTPRKHYSAQNTIQAQQRIYLTTGTVLLSNRGNPMLRIEDDTCGRHDTLGGACSAESNTVRYALEKRHMHSCRDSFLLALARREQGGLTKRDLPSNINFFMNVPVTPEGQLRFADGISAAGRHVQMTALMDTLVLISNCPQLNNPCNAYNPTPIRVMTWDPA